MVSQSSLEKRKNKNFVITNAQLLRNYAQKCREILGDGVIVVNLLLLDVGNLEELDLSDDEDSWKEPTVHQPVSYIPQGNFWYKMIALKIKKKHQIEIKESDNENKISIVFIKDPSIEHFSIYTIKQGKS